MTGRINRNGRVISKKQANLKLFVTMTRPSRGPVTGASEPSEASEVVSSILA